MYSKKQKIEIYINFFLALFAVELFNFFIVRKGVIETYSSQQQLLPWALPFHLLLPIWTILYAAMAVAGAMIYIKPTSHIRDFALASWVIQLVITIIWPVCFYYIHLPVLTPILITLLFMTLVVFMFYSFLLDRKVVIIIFPYLIMVIYKLIFHWIFYILNIDLL